MADAPTIQIEQQAFTIHVDTDEVDVAVPSEVVSIVEIGVPGMAGPTGNDGADGADGAPGADGNDGAPGVGIPAGGTNGQLLFKNGTADYDVSWGNVTYLDLSGGQMAGPAKFIPGTSAAPGIASSVDADTGILLQNGYFEMVAGSYRYIATRGYGGGQILMPRQILHLVATLTGGTAIDVGNSASRYITISGSGWTCSALGSVPIDSGYGYYVDLEISGDGLFTHDPAAIQCPNDVDLAVSDGDVVRVRPVGTGTISAWKVIGHYSPAPKAIADISGLQTALDGKVTDSDVRGGAASLNDRLGCISNFASPNAGGVVTGQYYDNSFQGTASSTLAGAANRLDLAPYYTSVPLSIDQIGVAVSTAVAAATGKVVIYSADADGWPDVLLYESGDLDFSTTGYKSAALTFTFDSGVQYWVGVHHSSTATIRSINVSSAVNLGLTSSSAANYATILRRTVAYANSAPSPWNFVNRDRVANTTPPSIRFRAA